MDTIGRDLHKRESQLCMFATDGRDPLGKRLECVAIEEPTAEAAR